MMKWICPRSLLFFFDDAPRFLNLLGTPACATQPLSITVVWQLLWLCAVVSSRPQEQLVTDSKELLLSLLLLLNCLLLEPLLRNQRAIL